MEVVGGRRYTRTYERLGGRLYGECAGGDAEHGDAVGCVGPRRAGVARQRRSSLCSGSGRAGARLGGGGLSRMVPVPARSRDARGTGGAVRGRGPPRAGRVHPLRRHRRHHPVDHPVRRPRPAHRGRRVAGSTASGRGMPAGRGGHPPSHSDHRLPHRPHRRAVLRRPRRRRHRSCSPQTRVVVVGADGDHGRHDGAPPRSRRRP